MRYNLAVATLAILVTGIVSCSQSVPTPTPAAVVTPEPTPVPAEPSVAAQASPAVSPGATPGQETQAVTPSVDKVPFQDTPTPPVSDPAAVPTPGPSSQEPVATGPRLAGKVVLVEAQELFSQRGLVLEPELAKVSVLGLDGSQVAVGGRGDSFSFNLPAGAAYLLKAQTVDGAVLWALTPVLSGDTTWTSALKPPTRRV